MFGNKGKIDIAVQKLNYAPGDSISGNVTLALKKPVSAREMNISLIGEQLIKKSIFQIFPNQNNLVGKQLFLLKKDKENCLY